MVSAVRGPVPHTYTPQGTAIAVLPSIDVDSWIAVVMRSVLGIVVSAGARFWHVRSVPAAIQRRTRAALDVRKMVPSDLGNRSPGQASRGLGLRDGLRGRASRAAPEDRKSTRLNSSHITISYAVFCLKKKKK